MGSGGDSKAADGKEDGKVYACESSENELCGAERSGSVESSAEEIDVVVGAE